MIATVLGASGSVPGPAGACSAYLVEHDGYGIVLDLGTGALGPLLRHRGADHVDAVVLSHLHTDHCADLPALAYAQEKLGSARPEPTRVLAPGGAAEMFGDRDHVATRLRFTVMAEGRAVRLGPFHVTVAPARHQVPAYAIRVEAGGRSLAYTGDTGPSDAVERLVRDADLLLCEAALAGAGPDDGGAPNHLDAAQAGALAHRSGVRALVLTHLRPWADPDQALERARGRYAGPIALAVTDLKLAV